MLYITARQSPAHERQQKTTHEIVVRAADGVRRARAAGADAEDINGRAGDTDDSRDILDDNVEEADEHRDLGRLGLIKSACQP